MERKSDRSGRKCARIGHFSCVSVDFFKPAQSAKSLSRSKSQFLWRPLSFPLTV